MHIATPPSPLFGSVELAARIEAAEARMIGAAARAAAIRDPGLDAFARPLAGGVAAYAGGTSPLTKIAGLGFAGPLVEDALAEVEVALAARGVAPRIELSSLAEPRIAPLLGRRGYTLVAVEHVLGRALVDEVPRAIEGVEVATSDPSALDLWLDLVITGFAHPDEQGAGVDEEFPREILDAAMRDLAEAPGFTRLLARRAGAPAGAAGLQLDGEVALFCGAATLPAHRRRGVQTALLGDRLARARAAGCRYAVVTTQPGSRSQENVQRQGFHLLYTRAILVRGAAG